MTEVFKIQNVSTNDIELIDFGLIIPPLEIVDLGDFSQPLLSEELNTYLLNLDIVRLIYGSTVSYEEAYTTTVQVYNFDSSSVEASINILYNQDITINASLGLRPTFPYVDSSLNVKVNRILFDSSILDLTNKNISQDASIILRPTFPYVDASLNTKVNRTLFDSSILILTNKNISQDASLLLRPLTTYVDASLNVKADKTYVDASLNAKVNRTLFDSSIAFQTNWNISQDTSIIKIDGSLNTLFIKNINQDSSLNNVWIKFGYTDTSLNNLSIKNTDQDVSIIYLAEQIELRLKEASLGPQFYYVDGSLYVIDVSGTTPDVNKAYVDASLNAKVDKTLFDASILSLTNKDISQDASLLLRPLTTYVDASLNAKVNKILFDSSIAFQSNWNISQDASLTLRPLTTYVDASLNAKADKTYVDGSLNLKVNRTLFDASILSLTNKDISQDASLLLRPLTTYVDASLNAKADKTYVDASLNAKADKTYVDASLNAKVNRTLFDSSISILTNINISQDASLLLRPLTTYVDASLNVKVNRTLFDSSIAFQTNWNISQEASLNNRIKKTGDTMSGFLTFSGASGITRDNSANRVFVYGGTAESDGAYFQVTGDQYASSPFGSSAEFVIGERPQSQFSLWSYNGAGAWTQRFSLTGSNGLINITNDLSIGGSLRIANDSSIGNNLPYAQIDVTNGNKIVRAGNYYGQEYHSTFHTATTTTTAATPTYSSDTSINQEILPAGNYKITASYGMNKTLTNSDLLSRVQVDGVTLGDIHNHELPDKDTWLYTTRILYTALTAGAHTIDLQFSQEAAGTLSMRDVYLEIVRVS